ncbi:MAG TPA: hypothetical protein VFU36_18585 [Jatrophihabitans sp.]|nr:hypothetical protein [Jatrophihabitans sp.]
MSDVQEQWRAVHEALLHELRWRMAGEDLLITQDRADDLVDNLADVVVANFELIPRPPRVSWFRRRRKG